MTSDWEAARLQVATSSRELKGQFSLKQNLVVLGLLLEVQSLQEDGVEWVRTPNQRHVVRGDARPRLLDVGSMNGRRLDHCVRLGETD